MSRCYIKGTFVRTIKNAPSVSVLLLVSGIVMSPLNANASINLQRGGGIHGSGNGRHNKNSFSANSPAIQRGIQHVNNTNMGGKINGQAALCGKKRQHCKIYQKIVVLDR